MYAASPNGAGGAYAFWVPSFGYPGEILATQVLIDGSHPPEWSATGRHVLTSSHRITSTLAASDGEGGAYVAGVNLFAGNPPARPFVVTRMGRDGAPAPGWPDSGLVVAEASRPKVGARMIPDGFGGAYLVWLDAVQWAFVGEPSSHYVGVHEVRALRFLPGGGLAPSWPDSGVRVTIAPPDAALSVHLGLRAIADGSGGVFIAWNDSTDSIGDLYVQHLDGTGAIIPGWPAGGRAVSDITMQRTLRGLVMDGAGGVLVAWNEGVGHHSEARVARLEAGGSAAPGWPAGGLSLCDTCVASFGGMVADGSGGTIVGLEAWPDLAQIDLFATHVLGAGVIDPAWPAGSLPLATTLANEYILEGAVSDGSSGAFFLWRRHGNLPDPQSSQEDLYATRVTAGGTIHPEWPTGGLLVSDRPGHLVGVSNLLSERPGGALAMWMLSPPDSSDKVYAYRLGADGQPTTEVPYRGSGVVLAVRPNPFTVETRVTFTLSSYAPVSLDVYDIRGRRVRTLLNGSQPAGFHSAQWDGRTDRGIRAPAGLYFLRLRSADCSKTSRIVRLP